MHPLNAVSVEGVCVYICLCNRNAYESGNDELSFRLLLLYASNCLCYTLCKLFPRALLCCWAFCCFFLMFRAQVIHSVIENVYTSRIHPKRPREACFKVHATQPKCNNPVSSTHPHQTTCSLAAECVSHI